MSALGLGWQPSFAILLLVYFYSHYFFASNVAHVSAMYSAFLAVMVAAGAPPMLAALVLAFFSNTMGAISTWGMRCVVNLGRLCSSRDRLRYSVLCTPVARVSRSRGHRRCRDCRLDVQVQGACMTGRPCLPAADCHGRVQPCGLQPAMASTLHAPQVYSVLLLAGPAAYHIGEQFPTLPVAVPQCGWLISVWLGYIWRGDR